MDIIINPLSHLGQYMLHYYGTTNLTQIKQQDHNLEKQDAATLRKIKEIPARINLSQQEKVVLPI